MKGGRVDWKAQGRAESRDGEEPSRDAGGRVPKVLLAARTQHSLLSYQIQTA